MRNVRIEVRTPVVVAPHLHMSSAAAGRRSRQGQCRSWQAASHTGPTPAPHQSAKRERLRLGHVTSGCTAAPFQVSETGMRILTADLEGLVAHEDVVLQREAELSPLEVPGICTRVLAICVPRTGRIINEVSTFSAAPHIPLHCNTTHRFRTPATCKTPGVGTGDLHRGQACLKK